MSTTYKLAQEGIDLWQEITGLKLNATTINAIRYDELNAINRAWASLTLDPTGVTSALLISNFFQAHMSQMRFSIADVRTQSPAFTKAMSQADRMEGLLHNPEFQNAAKRFDESVLRAVAHYGAEDSPKVQELLQDKELVIILRHSAFKSRDTLRVDQFLQGDCEPSSVKPVFVPTIHKWWSLNELLGAATRMPSGISLNYISCPNAVDNFFAIVVRNGGNLYVLSDRDSGAHPLQSEMTRSPERKLDARVAKHWFPYELADLELDSSNRKIVSKMSDERSLTVGDAELKPMAELKSIDPRCLLWTAMVFSLIVDRFWGNKITLPQLSYTGEMVSNNQVLLERAAAANLPIVSGSEPAFERLDIHAISAGVATEDEIGLQVLNRNQWLVDRFSDKVSPALLNLIETDGAKPLMFIDFEGNSVLAESDEHFILEKADRSHSMVPRQLASTTFGTKQQLDSDRKFLGRYNFASAINALVDQEFEQRKNDVKQWFLAKCRANLPNILAYAHQPQIWLEERGNISGIEEQKYGPSIAFLHDERVKSFALERHEDYHPATMYHRFMKVFDMKEERLQVLTNYMYSLHLPKPTCAITGAGASYEVLVTPLNAKELAFMAGCSIEELPDVLQNWDLTANYTGNPLTTKVDPIHWMLHNPWHLLDLRIACGLSKRAMNQIVKQAKPIHFENLHVGSRDDFRHSTTIKLGGAFR